MRLSGLFGLCLVGAAAWLGIHAVQSAYLNGMQTVIASEPDTPKLGSMPPSSQWTAACPITTYDDLRTGRVAPCPALTLHEPAPVAHDIPTMSEADSERATMWFMLAGLGVPLVLIGTAIGAVWVIREL